MSSSEESTPTSSRIEPALGTDYDVPKRLNVAYKNEPDQEDKMSLRLQMQL